MNTTITNALIRCTRGDEIAHPAFERVRADLDIWVRELPENLDFLIADLSKILPLLKQLKTNSTDYTLHLAVDLNERHSLTISPILSDIAHQSGFSIELVSSP